MIKMFKDFDVKKYRDNILTEELEQELNDKNIPNIELTPSVASDPFLKKLALIVLNVLGKSDVGNYAVYPDIVYIDGVPGVWFYNPDNKNKSIVACRDSYNKTIAVFSKFSIDGENEADVTYSSNKLGFKAMMSNVVSYLQGEPVNEARFAAGYGPKHIGMVKELSDVAREYIVGLLTKAGKPGPVVREIDRGEATGDPVCKEIVTKFPGTILKYCVNIIWDAMNDTYPELRGILKPEHVSGGKGGSTEVTTTFGEKYDVEAYEEKLKMEHEKWLDDQTEEYDAATQLISDIVDTFCHYVKQNGVLNADDASVFTSKGLYITGGAGVGKTYAMFETMKKNNMVEKKDYFEFANGATDVDALYRTMYKYNGKLIILDDAANVVSGNKRIAFWKRILQTKPVPVRMPREARSDNGDYYEVGKKTRQERYFAEIGQKSDTEKEEYAKKRRKDLSSAEYSDREAIIKAEWDEMKKNTKPLIPDEFLFTGCIVVVGNMSIDELRAEVERSGGSGDWDAIQQRFQPISVNPPYEVIWRVLQRKLREEQSKSEDELPDVLCTIPRDYIDEFIDEVNSVLDGKYGPGYTGVSWRLLVNMSPVFRGTKGLRQWKNLLKGQMRKTAK